MKHPSVSPEILQDSDLLDAVSQWVQRTAGIQWAGFADFEAAMYQRGIDLERRSAQYRR